MYVRNSFAWIVGAGCMFGCTTMLLTDNVKVIVAFFGLGIAHGCFNSIYLGREIKPTKNKQQSNELHFNDR